MPHLARFQESPVGSVAVLSDDSNIASFRFLRSSSADEITEYVSTAFSEVVHRRTVTGGVSFGAGWWTYVLHNVAEKTADGRSGSFLVPQQRYFCNSSFERMYEKVEKLMEDTSTNWRIDNVVFGAGTWNCTMRGDAPKGSRSWFKCQSRKKMLDGIGQLRKQIPSLKLATLARGPEHWLCVLEGQREAPDSGEQYLEDESAASLAARVQKTCSQNRLLVNVIAGNRVGGYFASLVPGPAEVAGQVVSFGPTAEAAAGPLLQEKDVRVHALVFFEDERLWFLAARRYRSPLVRHTLLAGPDAPALLASVRARCGGGGEGAHGGPALAPAPRATRATRARGARLPSLLLLRPRARRLRRQQPPPERQRPRGARAAAADGGCPCPAPEAASRRSSLAPGAPVSRPKSPQVSPARPGGTGERKPSLSPSRRPSKPTVSPKQAATGAVVSPAGAREAAASKRSPFLARTETIRATAGVLATSQTARLPHAYAVVIGVDQYAEDARNVFDTLTSLKYCAYDPKNVRLLTGAAATRDAVRLAILDVASAAESVTEAGAASFIFYFSGHGTVKPAPRLVLAGDSGLSREELMSAISSVQVRVPRTLIILDCCHAGAIGALQAMKSGPMEWEVPNRQLADALLPKSMNLGRGHVQWVSSRPDELSRGWAAPSAAAAAGPGGKAAQSLFSKHLLAGLKGGTACRARGGRSAEACSFCTRLRKVAEADNALITISALFKYVVDHVREESDDAQHVQSSAIGLEDDFAIARLAPAAG
eukprot:tig00000093_g3568.t1